MATTRNSRGDTRTARLAACSAAVSRRVGPAATTPADVATHRRSGNSPGWDRRRGDYRLRAVAATLTRGASGATPTTAQPAPTVEQTALEGLLLDPDQINTALGTSGMAPTGSFTQMVDDSSAVSDRLCLPLDAVVEQSVYAASGWTAMRRQQVTDHQTHGVEQAVVLFPSAKAAATFFTASTHTWPACANRQFTETLGGQPEVHTVGAVTNTNGTLTAILTGVGARSGVNATCQRALTAVSNVVIDVGACTPGPSSAGVNIVHQIAAKVPTA